MLRPLVLISFVASLLTACVGASGAAGGNTSNAPPVIRRGFLGAFFRTQGPPPFGVFSVYSKNEAPEPYPRATTALFGPRGYCDAVAANGVSISSGYKVDAKKLANITDLGVRWTRTSPAPFFDDHSHVTGQVPYTFGDFDSGQCALVRNHITPLIALEAGPVQYDAVPGTFSPKQVPIYKTADDYGHWCGVIAAHERHTFSMVHRYSLPGNEINTNMAAFPDGDTQVTAYSEACYRAVKAEDPNAYVYGFELNMDAHAEPAAFLQRMYAAGCKVGTCYDGISIHLSLRYPIPSSTTPCYPQAGGDYSMQCITDIRQAAHAPIHLIIGETVYTVPGSVRDEETKAQAVVAELEAFARVPYIDGVLYANIDECDLYPSGYFVGGCLVDAIGNKLPGYTALRNLTTTAY